MESVDDRKMYVVCFYASRTNTGYTGFKEGSVIWAYDVFEALELARAAHPGNEDSFATVRLAGAL